MIKNIYAQRTTWIDSYNPTYNYGRQQTSAVYSTVTRDDRKGRMLVKFPDSISAYSRYDSVKLILTNVQSGYPTVDRISISVYPLTADWQQGTRYGDTGQRNFQDRTSTSRWSASGGDYNSSVGLTAVLDTPNSDIQLDVSSLVTYWASNPNHGLLVKMTDEAIQNGFRKYKSRHAVEKLYSPKIVASSSSDVVIDGSSDLYRSLPYSLYLYNYVNGHLIDVSGTGNRFSVRLVGLSAGIQVVTDTLSVSRLAQGIYQASSSRLPASSLLLIDSASAKWTVTRNSYYPSVYSTVKINSITGAAYDSNRGQLSFILGNRNRFYKKNQKMLLKPRMFQYKNIRSLDGNPTSVINSTSMYYRTVDYKTGKVITDWFPVGMYNGNVLQLDLADIFDQADQTKYQITFEFKIVDVYGQTLRFGQSIYDNCMITVI